MDYSSVAAAALSLTEAERANLASELLESLNSPIEDGLDAAWREEVARRAAEADLGEVRGVPWDEVRTALERQAEAHDVR